MKKGTVAIFSAVVLMLSGTVSAIPVSAATEAENVCADEMVSETVEYFEDGSYLTITVKQEAGIMPCGTVYEKSGSKAGVFRDKNGTELWRFTVRGTFSVNSGVSATCTKTSYSSSITDTTWERSSASTYASGNQAIGDATFIQKENGVTVETRSAHVVLTCDENGNLK